MLSQHTRRTGTSPRARLRRGALALAAGLALTLGAGAGGDLAGTSSGTAVAQEAPAPAPPPATVSFKAKRTVISAANAPGFQMPTSMAIGPDGRLYVAQQNGKIHVFTLDANNNATFQTVITTIFNRQNFTPQGQPKSAQGRQVTGIAFAPGLQNGQPVLYVSHSDPEIFTNKQPGQNSIDPDSGVVTKLVGPSFSQATSQDLVTGLPRSGENHSPNGMAFGPGGWLYLSIGGNTNFGGISKFFSYYPEVPLSAAVVRINPAAIGTGTVNASPGSAFTFVDPCGPGESVDAGQCSANSTVSTATGEVPGKFELYATGFRNGYDLLWHSNGKLYLNENEGNSGLGLTPGPADDCPASTPVDPGTPDDELFLVQQNGFYGHPNPSRGECQRDGGVGKLGGAYAPALVDYKPNKSSTNGIAEYTSNVFGGELQGELLSVNYASGNNLVRVKLSPGGNSVVSTGTLASGFSDPLDVIVRSNGAVFVAEHGGFPGSVSVLEPNVSGPSCPLPGDPAAIDSDGDGFTDRNEQLVGTDPCSASDAPPDLDGDRLPDQIDPDIDGDGIPNTADQLQRDPVNGSRTSLPFVLDFNTSEAGGWFGTGFLGVQLSSGGGGPLASSAGGTTLVGAGAAGGFVQITSTAGTAAGGANNQHNALQQGFDASSPFRVSAIVGEPFNTGLAGQESGGIFIGPSEDDFVRLVAHANGGAPIVEFGRESGGTFTRLPGSPALALPTDELELVLDADPGAGTVTALYRRGAGGPLQVIGTVNVPASLFRPGLAGIMTTSAGSAAERAFIMDDFTIARSASAPPVAVAAAVCAPVRRPATSRPRPRKYTVNARQILINHRIARGAAPGQRPAGLARRGRPGP
jgi:large repetitive protein